MAHPPEQAIEDELATEISKLDIASSAATTPPRSSRNVLPSTVASAISIFAKSSSLSLRIGGFFATAGIGAGRVATLTGFEVGRAVLEGILGRAGQDVVETSTGAIGRAAAESIMETALTALHRTITQTSFLVSAGFQIGSTGVSIGLAVGHHLISALDAVFGDTETSKAIATIIVLVQREINSAETGHQGEKVGLSDVLTSVVAFALLQRWGKRRTHLEREESGSAEVVWDLVVLSDSKEGTLQLAPRRNAANALNGTSEHLDDENDQVRPTSSASFMSALGGTQDFQGLQADDSRSFISVASRPHTEAVPDGQVDLSFREHLASQLQPGARVKVTMQSMSINSIIVEVQGDDNTLVEAPQGYTLIAADETEKDKRKLTFQSRTKRRKSGNFEVQKAIPPRRSSLRPGPLSWVESHEVELPDEANTPTLRTPPEDEMPASVEDAPAEDLSAIHAPRANQKRQRTSLAPLGESRLPVPTPTAAAAAAAQSPKPALLKAVRAGDTAKLEGVSSIKQTLKGKKSYKNLVEFWNQTPSKRRANDASRAAPPSLTVRSSSLANQPLRPASPALTRTVPLRTTAQMPSRPTSPAMLRRPPSSNANYALPTVENLAALNASERPTSRPVRHQRKTSSVYSMVTTTSETSLVLHNGQNEALDNPLVTSLSRSGQLPRQYPPGPFASIALRYLRFSHASYGSSFLRILGAAASGQEDQMPHAKSSDPAEHQSFSSYARLPSSTVLLSSFVDPQGVPINKDGADVGTVLVHFVSLDHDAKAVVLTCRGTLGFEDILTDLTADYEEFEWEGHHGQVHQGILHAAKKLLTSQGRRVINTLTAALEEFPHYGLVFCGHSLGGGVAAVLAMLLAQPNRGNVFGESAFITKLQPESQKFIGDREGPGTASTSKYRLPPGRSIHVYAYGPAASVTPSLQRATRGLVTTIIYGQDLVPYLSLGTLRDFQSVSLVLKTDTADAKGEIRRRVFEGLRKALRDRSGFGNLWPSAEAESSEDQWPWHALQGLRSNLNATKLLPAGEVIHIEGRPVLQRHAFVTEGERPAETRSFKPATHITVTHLRDVEKMLSELNFGARMWFDHVPIQYETALETLEKGLG